MTVSEDKPAPTKLPDTPWGQLPPSLRVLLITSAGHCGSRLAQALAADSATRVDLETSVGAVDGMSRLRDEVFDTVLVAHDPGVLDAPELLDAIRAGSHDRQPVLVLGEAPEHELTDICFESGADAYLCLGTTTTRTLLWQVARATERSRLLEENRRLTRAKRHQLALEHEEACRLLQEQIQLTTGASDSSLDTSQLDNWQAPPDLVHHYREILQTYVIMGAGNLTKEMQRLTGILVTAGISARQLMCLHLTVVDLMVSNLGTRSARHVMNRADLLIIQVLLQLCEGYRSRLVATDDRSHHLDVLRAGGAELRAA